VRLEGVRLNVKDGAPLWANINQGLEECMRVIAQSMLFCFVTLESELMSLNIKLWIPANKAQLCIIRCRFL